jgi:glyoxylase-like metal-dependent hydrolase (beta-lactamase superfamily II)
MLKLRIVQARYGDSLILENGYGKRKKYILVDGGPSKVYGPYLRGELKRIAASGGRLELVVLSHVDNDHVVGLLELVADLKKARQDGQPPLVPVRGLWHNSFGAILPRGLRAQAEAVEQEEATTPLPDPEAPLGSADEVFGIREGVSLLDAETALGITRNKGFPDRLVALENAGGPLRAGGMKLWLIGPPTRNLERLRALWIKWLTRESRDFAPGEAPVKPDDSTANLSSIMFLAEAGKRRILLTGDGLGEDILSGLEKTGLLPPDGTLHVDIFKLPHHGSARNALGQLFERVLADTYVLCANGKYGNPDWQTLLWLVDAACRQGRDIHIFATSSTPSLERLVEERPPQDNHYRLTIMPKAASSAVL